MKRLIDARKLIDDIARNIPIGASQQELEWSARVAQHFVNIIDRQPTAYKTDKVLEQLEERSQLIRPVAWTSRQEVILTKEVLEIVRKGGTE